MTTEIHTHTAFFLPQLSQIWTKIQDVRFSVIINVQLVHQKALKRFECFDLILSLS